MFLPLANEWTDITMISKPLMKFFRASSRKENSQNYKINGR